MNVLMAASDNVNAVPPTWRLATKFFYFVGLALAIGGVWTYLAVVRPALRRTPDLPTVDADLLRRRALRLASFGTLSLLVVAYFQLAGRVARAGKGMPYGEALDPNKVWAYLTKPAKAGEWVSTGALVSAQNILIVISALVLLPMAFGRVPRRADALAVIAAVTTVASTLAGSVPSTSPQFEKLVPSLLTQAHIIGGSLWVGGLVALALLARARGSLSAGAGRAWSIIWERFGVLALVSVGMVLVSGLWLTYDEVGAFGQFLSTNFGRFLLLKIAVVLGLIAAGAFNQLSLMPRIARAQREGSDDGVFALTLRHFPKVVWTEVVLGIGVLAVVPFLSSSARSQAAGHDVDGPTFDTGLFTLGLLLVVTLAVCFYATAKASEVLGRRPAAS